MPLKTVLIVPCFNEARRLPGEKFRDFALHHPDCSFLFVNDGSTDQTEAMLATVCDGASPQFDYINCGQNMGKGGAVHHGFLAASKRSPKYIGYWDSDLSAPLNELDRMIALMDAQPATTLVMGARERSATANIRRTRLRSIIGQTFRWLRNRLLDTDLTDTQCGAKLMRVCPPICCALQTPFLTRWLFDIEIIMRLQSSDPEPPEIVTMPLNQWADSGGSRVTFWEMIRIVFELASLVRIHRVKIVAPTGTLRSE
ncbi:Poly-beta-1,6-N-acetyl-D-glucosamine synthase [Rubripirellula lacrimiformis]|uniref:Poly-beta-1,6-N-acetyl-D-glucosamine synthase n=1 Tax=Rubripirellula lacrimiformis TaxID=1930273 RepID=A0A517NJW9_9BACT|nr:glycosyltransferase [Rubripirellula lacrimiformis]QDT07420.1 Poly-beta-1,6-N-acetyl-D-glucosamine synthase [Rubripirellula lacrimiformis]